MFALVALFALSPGAGAAPGPAPASAPSKAGGPFDPRHFTCPIGGKEFDQDVGYFALPLLTLPDGSWLGDSLIDAQIPACPDNGLVILPDYGAMAERGVQAMVYHDYSPGEIARLPGLIADPAYVSLKPEGRHAQAYWLATKLGRPALDRFVLLQRATWAASDRALRRRLVGQLAAEGPGLIEAAEIPASEKRHLQYYVVNALRELGRFDEALALLARIGVEGSDEYGPKLHLAIAEKDDGRFPIELLDRRMVDDICGGKLYPPYDQVTPATAAACKARRDRETREAAESDAAVAEAVDLEEKPEALAARCAATPEAKRGKGVAMACDSLQERKDERAAAALVRDGPALAAACEATPQADLKGALFDACISFGQALESTLGDVLAGDDQAWAILCPGGAEAELEDRDGNVSGACVAAGRLRQDREVEALLADPGKIEARCANTPRDEMPIALFSACLERETRNRDARIQGLAGDEAAFGLACGRFRQAIARPSGSGDDEEEICRDAYNLRENRKARAAAEAKGLVCWESVSYGPDRPRCVPRAEYEAERARSRAEAQLDDRFEQNSSLMSAARVRAAAIVARAKADRTYPKRRPGDRF